MSLNDDYPCLISAKILADSINPRGVRLTTMEIVCHRFVLSEFNTHRRFSRNSASSRAIPVDKTLARFREQLAVPLEWPAEQPGMSGGAELQGDDLEAAQELYERIHKFIGFEISKYFEERPEKEHRLHKSVLNRLMEFGQYHTIIVSSTEWENYFRLRLSPQAQPEIRAVAEKMKEVYDASTPAKLKAYEWHLPLYGFEGDDEATGYERVKLSVGRCARVSYLTHDGKRDLEADYGLFDKLRSSGHWSPFEHAAQAMPGFKGSGNFDGFVQARHYEESGEAPRQAKPRKKRVVKAKPSFTLPPQIPASYFNQTPPPQSWGNTFTSTYMMPVITNPKAFFSSPACEAKPLLVVAATRNDADRAMYEVERELYSNPNSWFRYQSITRFAGQRLKWQYVDRSYAFRGLRDCNLILVDGWNNAYGWQAMEDEINQAAKMGIIKTVVQLP